MRLQDVVLNFLSTATTLHSLRHGQHIHSPTLFRTSLIPSLAPVAGRGGAWSFLLEPSELLLRGIPIPASNLSHPLHLSYLGSQVGGFGESGGLPRGRINWLARRKDTHTHWHKHAPARQSHVMTHKYACTDTYEYIYALIYKHTHTHWHSRLRCDTFWSTNT
jgi:hypothetical protein